MSPEKLTAAIAEAERFIARAKAVQANPPRYSFVGTPVTGAARRASMDLTRALADLRRAPR